MITLGRLLHAFILNVQTRQIQPSSSIEKTAFEEYYIRHKKTNYAALNFLCICIVYMVN